MFAKVESELKLRLRRAGYTQKRLSHELKVPYSTVCSWLGGFVPLPLEARKRIEIILRNRESDRAKKVRGIMHRSRC